MMADVQKIMAKCGDNEACITRESQKIGRRRCGARPRWTRRCRRRRTRRRLARPTRARYQAWHADGAKGQLPHRRDRARLHPRSLIARAGRASAAPATKCARARGEMALPPEAKKSGGAAGLSAVEVDAEQEHAHCCGLPGTDVPAALTPRPSRPMEPAGSRDTPTPKGPQKKQLIFRVGSTSDRQAAHRGAQGRLAQPGGRAGGAAEGRIRRCREPHHPLALQRAVTTCVPGNRITILHDSFGKHPELKKDWGFAALVEIRRQTHPVRYWKQCEDLRPKHRVATRRFTHPRLRRDLASTRRPYKRAQPSFSSSTPA